MRQRSCCAQSIFSRAPGRILSPHCFPRSFTCTLAMLLCLDRDARLAYILGAIVELEHQVAADILECAPATYRKRLERARDAITGLMRKRCGVFDGGNGCHCAGRIPIAKRRGHLDPSNLIFASSTEQARRFPQVLSHSRCGPDPDRGSSG